MPATDPQSEPCPRLRPHHNALPIRGTGLPPGGCVRDQCSSRAMPSGDSPPLRAAPPATLRKRTSARCSSASSEFVYTPAAPPFRGGSNRRESNMRYSRRSLGVAASLLFVGAAQADITFSDSVFNNGDWSVNTVGLVTGGTSTGVQTGGGNPGTGREVTNTMNLLGTIYSLHAYGATPATTYQPAVKGAVSSVEYTLDARWLSGIGGQGEGIALGAMQGSSLYYADYDITGSTGAWNTFGAVGLVAADFVSFNGGPAINLSAAGAPIRFGFVVGNYAPDQAYSNTVIYDNFSVTIHSVPAPGAACALLGMGAMAAARRHRTARGPAAAR